MAALALGSMQSEGGILIIGVAEYEGSIYKADGIDMEALLAFRKSTGSILNFPGSTTLDARDAALYLDCDILIPAALENQICVCSQSLPNRRDI